MQRACSKVLGLQMQAEWDEESGGKGWVNVDISLERAIGLSRRDDGSDLSDQLKLGISRLEDAGPADLKPEEHADLREKLATMLLREILDFERGADFAFGSLQNVRNAAILRWLKGRLAEGRD